MSDVTLEQMYELVLQLTPVERRQLAVHLERYAEVQPLSAQPGPLTILVTQPGG